MITLSSANVTDVNLVLKERTHMRLCINMLIFTHNLGNWLIPPAHGLGKPSMAGQFNLSLKTDSTEEGSFRTVVKHHPASLWRVCNSGDDDDDDVQ